MRLSIATRSRSSWQLRTRMRPIWHAPARTWSYRHRQPAAAAARVPHRKAVPAGCIFSVSCGQTSQRSPWAQHITEVSLVIESMVTPVFATLIFDDIIGLLKSIRRLNRATMSSAPDEPQKNYTASDEPFRYTGSSTGRSAVCIINDQYSQNQISDCLNYLLL